MLKPALAFPAPTSQKRLLPVVLEVQLQLSGLCSWCVRKQSMLHNCFVAVLPLPPNVSISQDR
jgi:hypothetical protein